MKMKTVVVLLLGIAVLLVNSQTTTSTTPDFSQTYPSVDSTSISAIEFVVRENTIAYAFQVYPATIFTIDLTPFHNATEGYTDETYGKYIALYSLGTINSGNPEYSSLDTPGTAFLYTSQANQSNSGMYIGGTSYLTHYDRNTFEFKKSVYISENFAPRTSFVDEKTSKAYAANDGGFLLYEFDLESFSANTTKNYTMPISQVRYSIFNQEESVVWLFNRQGDVLLFNTSTRQSLNTFSIANSTASYQFQSASIDYDRKLIYVVCQRDVSSTSTLPYLHVYSYTDDVFQTSGTVPQFLQETPLSEAVNVDPSNLVLDLNGGQALIGLVDYTANTATWTRFDLNSRTIIESSIFITNGNTPVLFDLSPLGFNQTTAVLTDSGVNMFTYPTSCENDCSSDLGQGYCDYGTCVCANGFSGSDCSQIACATDCGASINHGTCNNGVCLCGALWTGDNCAERRCPLGCSGNGDCNIANNYTCGCSYRWTGPGCDTPKQLTCEEVPEAAECTGRVGECGWCHSEGKCKLGNSVGPVYGACPDWFTESPKDIGIMAFAIIYIIICGILILINIISSAVIDHSNSTELITSKRLTSDTIRRNWWRDERSNMGWALFEQLQFISLYAVVTVAFPTRILSFTRYFDFTNFILPLPNYEDLEYHPERSTRTMSSYEQFGNGNDSGISQIWYAQMVWLCIAFAVATIIYVIYALISLLIRGMASKEVFISRLVHMWLRMLTVGYFPLVLIAAAHTRYGGTSIVGSIIALILFGVGLPALSFALTFRRSKELFRYEWRAKFGVFYSTFHFKYPYFQLAVLAKKAVLAMVIGFMAAPVGNRNQAYGQVAGAIVVMFIWIVVLLVTKPYLDKTHLLLEIALSVLNIVSIGMALTHIFVPSLIGDIIFILLQIIGLLVCVGAFIHCWLAMENVNCCSPKGSKEEENTSELDTVKM